MNLDESAVGRLLRMEEVIPAMERALADFSSGTVVQPVRTMLPVAEHGGFLGLMPAYTGSALGAKLVAFYPRNTSVPTHHATILLFEPETGEPLVTMDGQLITEVRTAAVSAVATDHLARADASVLAIIGSGVQARSHLEALRLVREFREVRVWSPRRAAAFAEEHGVDAAASAEEAVRGADVVVTATTSPTPVLSGEWLSPGAHINAVGAPRLERARRRGTAPRQGLRGLAGGRHEGERRRHRSQGGPRRDRGGDLWSGAGSSIRRGGDTLQVARTGGGGRGYGRVGLPQCPRRRVAAVLSRLFTRVRGRLILRVRMVLVPTPKAAASFTP